MSGKQVFLPSRMFQLNSIDIANDKPTRPLYVTNDNGRHTLLFDKIPCRIFYYPPSFVYDNEVKKFRLVKNCTKEFFGCILGLRFVTYASYIFHLLKTQYFIVQRHGQNLGFINNQLSFLSKSTANF